MRTPSASTRCCSASPPSWHRARSSPCRSARMRGRSMREADIGAAHHVRGRSDKRCRGAMCNALLALHDKHPFPHTPAEIAEIAAAVRDPNFRVRLPRRRARLQSRRPPWRRRSLRALAVARARARRGACLLHGRGAGTRADRLAARQALRAGRAARLGRAPSTAPRTLAAGRAGHDAARHAPRADGPATQDPA